MKATTHIQLVPRLRMCGIKPPLPYTPSWHREKHLYLVLFPHYAHVSRPSPLLKFPKLNVYVFHFPFCMHCQFHYHWFPHNDNLSVSKYTMRVSADSVQEVFRCVTRDTEPELWQFALSFACSHRSLPNSPLQLQFVCKVQRAQSAKHMEQLRSDIQL